jgi:hypothetical protein
MADTKRVTLDSPPRTTPAGSQINSDWEHLEAAIAAMTVWVGWAWTRSIRAWLVLFRCGTVARVTDDDPEFGGYRSSAYAFPDPGPDAAPDAAETVTKIMADNARVWAAQRNLAGGGEIALAVRRAYAKMLGEGYQYPGAPTSVHLPMGTDVVTANGLRLETVFWPKLGAGGHVFNLALVPVALGVQDAARSASDAVGRLRQYDYMFPEVAAVFAPEGCVWAYGPDGVFACRDPGPEGTQPAFQ